MAFGFPRAAAATATTTDATIDASAIGASSARTASSSLLSEEEDEDERPQQHRGKEQSQSQQEDTTTDVGIRTTVDLGSGLRRHGTGCHRDDRPFPKGVAIDKHGAPTTSPAAALEGAQLPFGGHKGSAIAMMVELLAAGLTGSHLSFEADDDNEDDDKKNGPTNHGELFSSVHLPKKNLKHINNLKWKE